MKKSTLITPAVGVVLGIVACKLLWTTVEPKIEKRIDEFALTDNEKAANGPLPGDIGLFEKELAVSQAIASPGYYPSINGAEMAGTRGKGEVHTGTNHLGFRCVKQ